MTGSAKYEFLFFTQHLCRAASLGQMSALVGCGLQDQTMRSSLRGGTLGAHVALWFYPRHSLAALKTGRNRRMKINLIWPKDIKFSSASQTHNDKLSSEKHLAPEVLELMNPDFLQICILWVDWLVWSKKMYAFWVAGECVRSLSAWICCFLIRCVHSVLSPNLGNKLGMTVFSQLLIVRGFWDCIIIGQ